MRDGRRKAAAKKQNKQAANEQQFSVQKKAAKERFGI